MKRFFVNFAVLFCFSATSLIYAAENNIFDHPVTAQNIPELEKVQKMLSVADNLKGDFTQTRHIALLSAPLISSGNFVISKTTGLTWDQLKPFASSLQVTDTKLIQKMGDNPPTIITKEQQPIVFSFTSIFLSIFKGDTAKVKQYFEIYFTGDTKHWEIALKPNSSPLNKAIASIELSGGKYIQTVTINEVKKNKMVITFSNIQPLLGQ